MQRRNDRMSPHKDDEMKRELQGMLQSGHPTRVEEWHDPEPAADDDPQVAPWPVPGTGNERDTLRYELARYTGRTPFPARRGALLHALHERNAPDRLIDLVRGLPQDHTYQTVQEVASALVAGPE